VAKPKPQAPGGDKGKAACDADDRALTKASKAKTPEGAVRNLGRIIRGKGN
jgi:hypothetical protein